MQQPRRVSTSKICEIQRRKICEIQGRIPPFLWIPPTSQQQLESISENLRKISDNYIFVTIWRGDFREKNLSKIKIWQQSWQCDSKCGRGQGCLLGQLSLKGMGRQLRGLVEATNKAKKALLKATFQGHNSHSSQPQVWIQALKSDLLPPPLQKALTCQRIKRVHNIMKIVDILQTSEFIRNFCWA